MGRLFLLNYKPAPTDHYTCKWCRTHIALHKDYHKLHNGEGKYGALFNNAINLIVDEPGRHEKVGVDTIAEVFCIKCGDKLGWKYIEVSTDLSVVKKDMVKLNARKVVRKKGDEILVGSLMFGVPADD